MPYSLHHRATLGKAMGVNKGGQGDKPPEFGVGYANANCPPDFQKIPLRIHHFKGKFQFLRGRASHPSTVDLTPRYYTEPSGYASASPEFQQDLRVWGRRTKNGDVVHKYDIKAKFHYARWFEAARRHVRNQIPLRCLVRSWFEAGRRQVRSLSATSFEPASNQLA